MNEHQRKQPLRNGSWSYWGLAAVGGAALGLVLFFEQRRSASSDATVDEARAAADHRRR